MAAVPKAQYAMAVEDYVKVIYAHTEWQPDPITTSVLAGRLGLAASSVTEMVKKLGAQGLVDHVPYGAVTLTTDGTALALRMLRRHRLIETWLVRHFGYGWRRRQSRRRRYGWRRLALWIVSVAGLEGRFARLSSREPRSRS